MFDKIYKTNLSLLTDLYQLTMAYGYFKQDMHQKEAVFHLFFRRNPFKGHYAIACGLELAIEYLKNIHFSAAEIHYLRSLNGSDNKPLFDEAFLELLQNWDFQCNIDAIPEGTVVFANEPLLRVQGPIWQAQLLETTLLNIINFSTLIATKAARIVAAAQNDTILEFGLRRAQGVDGALTASRAAYIGGVHATSNVLAGQLFGIPVRGTHAHAWVMSFEDEKTAFEQYAHALPNNLTFLVDTYNTLEGVKKAIQTVNNMQTKNTAFGIRLDSGDLAALSIAARKLLDEAGYPNAKIVASNDLDEYEIEKLKKQGAKIDIWGVGTKLVTAYDQPALGGVYKLAALRNEKGDWDYKIKLSEDLIKVSNPGILQVRRVYSADKTIETDLLYDETDCGTLPKGVDLLKPIFIKGKLVYQNPNIHALRANTLKNVAILSSTVTVVKLEKQLEIKKLQLMNARKTVKG
jgi:nicotinate phosphoribosyltransferase